MKEIRKLDDKYLVLKKEDLERYFSQFTKGIFTTEKEAKFIDSIPFNTVLEEIQEIRERNGNGQNQYLVLNLDDEIDLDYFGDRFFGDEFDENQTVKVKDIAVALVNAVIKAKGD